MTQKQLKARYNKYLNIVENASIKYLNVYNFYDNPSGAKGTAEYLIHEKMKKYNGHKYRIIGGNCHQFQCGWIYEKENKKFFVFETYKNTYTLQVK